MPRLENIERFKEILYTLGSEPEINAQSSELREDDVGSGSEAGGDLPTGTEPDSGLEAAPDLGLDSAGAPAGEELPALGLDDLFGEGHELPPSSEAEGGAAPAAEAEEPIEAGPGFEGEAGLGEALDNMELGDLLGEAGGEGQPAEGPSEEPPLGDELGAMAEGLGETEGTAETEEPVPGAEAEAEGGDLGLANGFFMPDLGLEESPAAEGAEPASPGEPEGGLPEGDAGLGLGEDFSLPEPEPGAEAPVDVFAEAGAETPTEPAPAGEAEGGLPEGDAGLGLGEDFSLPEPTAEEGSAPTEGGGERGTESFDPFALDTGSMEAGEQGASEPEGLGGAEGAAEAAERGGEAAPSGPAEAETFDIDSFDTSSLGSGAEEGAPAAPAPAGGAGDSIDELAEGFSLEGLAEGVAEGVGEPEGAAAEAAPEREEGGGEPAELTLEDREFRAIQRNLESLPRNLKIAIESLLGEQAYAGEGLRPLLDMLIRGSSPQTIAAHVGKLTGRTIKIPLRFERQTGAEFEEEKRSFAYLFRKVVLPLLRTFLIVAASAAALAYLGYAGVYIPLHAESLYRGGYRAIEQGRYGDSAQSFQAAVNTRQVKGWYYRYAEAYEAKKEYLLADRMYQTLDAAYVNDRKGLLDRARLQSTKLGSYATAEELLNKVTDKDFFDKDALLGLGDNYLEWARHAPVTATKEGERTRKDLLEEARLEFARLLERYGYKNDILFRMMRYFVRADLLSDVQDLRAYLEADEEFKPDPDVYAEVGGYLLDKGEVEDARSVLVKTAAVGTEVPELDYNLARLFLTVDDPAEEAKALRNALLSLGRADQTPERIFMAIDVHRRYGRWYYRQEQYIDSAKEFQTAIAGTEDALSAGILSKRPELGLPYEGLGDIRYYIESDYPAALELYTKARNQGIEDPSLDYRIGYVHFAQGDYAKALSELVPVEERLPGNWNVLFGLATALYQRSDFSAAEGYYRRLLDKLIDMRNGITELKPDVNPVHFMLANMLTKAHNNLGVTYYMEARRKGGRGRELTRALVEVTEASQYLDLLSRDPETLARSEAKNLAYLNASAIQHPASGFEPAIYDRIPKDTEAERF